MLIYRDDIERVATGAFIAACRAKARSIADADGRTSLLVDVGMLEAALADALMPAADDFAAAALELRRAALAAARLFCGTAEGAPLEAALARLQCLPWPAAVDLRTPEGYAYYALDPAAYAASARRVPSTVRRLVCIGLRSIGTSLSAVVAAALEAEGREVETLTLRPRGHPFDRRPVATPALRHWLGQRLDAMFLIVDEGPGRSGSSFCGTAAFLEELGVPTARIGFVPGHAPDPAQLVSPAARDRWPRHPFWAAAVAPPFPAGGRDLSGGAWRPLVIGRGQPWPAVLPWQERRKFLGADGRLHKFAGFGRFGERALARAEALATAGYTPSHGGLAGGYVAQAFVPGRPLRRGAADAALLGFASSYLGHLGRHHASGAAADPSALVAMAARNIALALGRDLEAALARHAAALPPAPAVALDGRVLPHEWLRTPAGFVKVDALDHHADHFFPGVADIAWDVAGLAAEFGLDPADLAAGFGPRLRDPTLPARLPFYLAAYLAFRTGYAASALASLADEEARRMRRALARYRRLLRTAVARLEPG